MGSSFVLFYVSVKITLGHFRSGESGIHTKTSLPYGAFKGTSISSLFFVRDNGIFSLFLILILSAAPSFFCRPLVFHRLFFSAAHFFFRRCSSGDLVRRPWVQILL